MAYIVENGFVNVNLQSVYKFANSIGKRPQQLYQMLDNGSFPEEFIQYVAKAAGGHQPMVKVKEATAFFASKEEVIVDKGVKKVIENPALVADAFINMLEKDDPKLGKRVREWWAKKNAPPAATPEAK
jgi:hypothetical protein